MKTRSAALIASVAILGSLGLFNLVQVLRAMGLQIYGVASSPLHITTSIAAVLSTLFWSGLALLHWSRRGSWGRRIALFAGLFYLFREIVMSVAISRGAEWSSSARFEFLALAIALALIVSSFLSYPDDKTTAVSATLNPSGRGSA